MDPDPYPRKEIEVDPDPDLDPERGIKWIRIRIRPNAVDPDPDPKRWFIATFFPRTKRVFIAPDWLHPRRPPPRAVSPSPKTKMLISPKVN